MFGEEKNLKDSSANLGTTIKDSPLSISYTKINKLITALYMVTDIIDKDEPLRTKLRTLGTEIISDIHLIKQNHTVETVSLMLSNISETLSFLDISSALNIISEMNCNILKKEFLELDQSIKEATNKETLNGQLNRQINLSEFFREELPTASSSLGGEQRSNYKTFSIHHAPAPIRTNIGHHRSTNIGVQKASTLLKALSGGAMSDRNTDHTNTSKDVFDLLRKQRSDSIINIIKTINGGATIKDIKDKVNMMSDKNNVLVSCGEKTLQRELVSMVKNGVLDKMGEKRWSKYFLK